ncbi:MAG TPA: hypothetical protein VGC13_31215 [Longimicrobium sp.]|jgi:proteic killer suppression protein|uniref:type II toxin-antitoxin system RelE/ParE family toxin n=1 Tax=Longimicrobium sp. TaxID=2029185 RepID=UPI002ED7DC07
MEIHFKTRKLKATCESAKESDRAWGKQRAAVVRRRLVQLASADDLGVIETVPPALLHPLKGDRKGQWAVDAVPPFRLIFEIADDPVPLLDDGGVDKSRVTEIRILEVKDYHGR